MWPVPWPLQRAPEQTCTSSIDNVAEMQLLLQLHVDDDAMPQHRNAHAGRELKCMRRPLLSASFVSPQPRAAPPRRMNHLRILPLRMQMPLHHGLRIKSPSCPAPSHVQIDRPNHLSNVQTGLLVNLHHRLRLFELSTVRDPGTRMRGRAVVSMIGSWNPSKRWAKCFVR